MKLPIGSIRPNGWLRHQLRAGGRRPGPATSRKFPSGANFEGNAWAAADGQGENGWEELPYWLKGFGDLGYVLRDERIIKKLVNGSMQSSLARNPTAGSARARSNLAPGQARPLAAHGHADVLQSFYEYSPTRACSRFMLKYHSVAHSQPGQNFGNGYWPKIRFGDNVETAYWLYNRTGEACSSISPKNPSQHGRLVQRRHQLATTSILRKAFGSRVFFMSNRMMKKSLKAAERNYQKVMGLYGQFPGGGFGGDENCRPGYIDPRQGSRPAASSSSCTASRC